MAYDSLETFEDDADRVIIDNEKLNVKDYDDIYDIVSIGNQKKRNVDIAYNIYELAKAGTIVPGITIVGRLIRATAIEYKIFAPKLSKTNLTTRKVSYEEQKKEAVKELESCTDPEKEKTLSATVVMMDDEIQRINKQSDFLMNVESMGVKDTKVIQKIIIEGNLFEKVFEKQRKKMKKKEKKDAIGSIRILRSSFVPKLFTDLSIGNISFSDHQFERISNVEFPGIDSALKANFICLREQMETADVFGGGSILETDNWTCLSNDAWLLGGIHGKTTFHYASPLWLSNLWDDVAKRVTVTGRELIGILAFGYKLERQSEKLEVIATLRDEEEANKASLIAYNKNINTYNKRDQFIDFIRKDVESVEGKDWIKK